MGKFSTISGLFIGTLACLLGITTAGHAEERRLVNTSAASLREGPGPQYKVIKPVQSTQSFEVLESVNDFVKIRTKDGSEGWIYARFTEPQVSDEPAATDVSDKGDVHPKRDPSEYAPAKESHELKKLQAELAEAAKQLKELQAIADEAEQMKFDQDTLKKELAAKQNTITQLQQTNASLATNQKYYWFLAGGAVFLVGWLIGKSSSRRQRHSSLTL